MRIFVLFIVLSGFLGVAAEDTFFQKINFEDALSKAKETNKIVFIDFYTTWCAPCKMLDRSTWKDESVIAWLKQHTVPLKIDAEKETDLARKFKINSYPSLVFINPDGSEKGRLSGFRPAEAFLTEAKDVLAGVRPIDKVEIQLADTEGKKDPMLRMQYADELMQKGEFEKALSEYLWCFDQGHHASPAFIGVRGSFLLSRIGQLAQSYPPAKQALRDRRDALLSDVVLGSANHATVNDFAALNHGLAEEDETLKVYDRLLKDKPDSPVLGYLKPKVYPQLLEARRYNEIGPAVQDEIQKLFMSREQMAARLAQVPRAQRKMIEESQHAYFMEQLGKAYQVLIGTNRNEEAKTLADRMLDLDANPETLNILAWNGYLTGSPTDTNLEQARKANEMTGGQNGAVIDTLARVLRARGQTEEAINLVKGALELVSDPNHRQILNECLADISR